MIHSGQIFSVVYHHSMTSLLTDPCFSLTEVSVRLVASHEVAHWQALMEEHHYLGFSGFVGERLYQVAEWHGQWLALIGWAAAYVE